MKNKWIETGVNVCNRTLRNQLNEKGFTYRKARGKPTLRHKHKRMRLKWAEEKQSCCVDY